MKEQISKDKKLDSKYKIKVVKIDENNLKENQNVRIAPSTNIIKFIVDTIAENGIAGIVIKGKDDKLYITAAVNLVADAKEIIQHETVVEEFENADKDEKETESVTD